MLASSNCKPWCTSHENPDCWTTVTIWGNREEKKPVYAEGSSAAQMQALGGMAKEVTCIQLVVWQEDEDEQPYAAIEFFEAESDEPVASTPLGTDGLKEIHSALGAALRIFV